VAASGLLPDELAPAMRGEQAVPAELPENLAVAMSRFLARTPCRLVAIQLEDLAAMKERMNLPGTVDEQPNWRRKLPLNLDALFQSRNLIAITTAVAEERPRPNS
jgi:4-alpha-glucanotransferase